MWLCLDVNYDALAAVTATVGCVAPTDAAAAFEVVARSQTAPLPYEPGAFYRREMPYLVDAVAFVRARRPVEGVIIDGHVWLEPGKPGLGAHLHGALGSHLIVVGVAKTPYHGGVALPVVRGQSQAPLWVSAEGMDAPRAAGMVAAMHGPHRLPTLLKRVDQLARGTAVPGPMLL